MTDFSLAQPGMKWLLEILRVQNIEKTYGNVEEAMRHLSRSDLPRLYPAASVAAQFPIHKNYKCSPFSSVDKANDKEVGSFTWEFEVTREIL